MLADDFQYFIKQAALRLDMRIFQLNIYRIKSRIFKRGKAGYSAKNFGFKTCAIVISVNGIGCEPNEN